MNQHSTVYGSRILGEELSACQPYILVTDEVPLQLHRDRLTPPPSRTVTVTSLERDELDQLATTLPPDGMVVGLGGGTVIDAAKYLASLRDCAPLLVPTITSTNAPFSDSISVRRDGTAVGMKQPGMPRRVVVDLDVITAADPRLNRAGYADVLALSTAAADWRNGASRGLTSPANTDLLEAADRIVEQCCALAPAVGEASDKGIRAIMELFEASTPITEEPGSALGAGSEHLFAWNLERVTGRHFIHGEIVGLGVVVAGFAQGGDYGHLAETLDIAGVQWRPAQLDIAPYALAETLHSLDAYNRDARQIHSMLGEVDWTPEQVDHIWQAVTN